MNQPDLFRYPSTHGFEPVDTSIAAAVSIDPTIIRERVYAFIKFCGTHGANSDEAEHRLGLRHQTCSARFRELSLSGRIVHDGYRQTSSGRLARVFITNEEKP